MWQEVGGCKEGVVGGCEEGMVGSCEEGVTGSERWEAVISVWQEV